MPNFDMKIRLITCLVSESIFKISIESQFAENSTEIFLIFNSLHQFKLLLKNKILSMIYLQFCFLDNKSNCSAEVCKICL